MYTNPYQSDETIKQQRVQQWQHYYMQQGYSPSDAQRQAMVQIIITYY